MSETRFPKAFFFFFLQGHAKEKHELKVILLPFGNSSIIWSKLVLGEVGVLVYMWGGKQGFYPFLFGKRSFLSRWGQGDFVSLRPALLLWKTVFHSVLTRQEYRKILKQVCRDVDKSVLPIFQRWMFSWYVALWQITLVLNDGICNCIGIQYALHHFHVQLLPQVIYKNNTRFLFIIDYVTWFARKQQ